MKTKISILAIAALAAALFVGCDDYGLSPKGIPKVTGTIHFVGTMPPSAQMCFFVMAYDRPPNDELDISYLGNYYHFPDSLIQTYSDTSVDFSMSGSVGTFNWNFLAILGENIYNLSINNVVAEYTLPGDTLPAQVVLDWGDSIHFDITVQLDSVVIP